MRPFTFCLVVLGLLLGASRVEAAPRPTKVFEGKAPTSAIRLSRDGKMLAAAFFRSGVGVVRVWAVESEKELAALQVITGEGPSLEFSAEGDTLYVGAQDGTVRCWRTKDWTEAKPLPRPETLTGIRSHVALALSPDGLTLAVGLGHPQWARPKLEVVVRLWDVAQSALKKEFKVADERGLRSVLFTPDGATVAVQVEFGDLTLWSPDGERSGAGVPSEFSPCFTPDGTRVVTGSILSGEIDICKVMPVEERGQVALTLKGHTNRVDAVALRPDGLLLASGCSNEERSKDLGIRLWSMETGKRLTTFPADAKGVVQLVFTADGKHLITAGRQGEIKFWDCEELLKK